MDPRQRSNGRSRSRLINGPAPHRWHPAIGYAPLGENFGTNLAIWDRRFGTSDPRAGKPSGHGLTDPLPDGFVARRAHAFRRVARQRVQARRLLLAASTEPTWNAVLLHLVPPAIAILVAPQLNGSPAQTEDGSGMKHL